MILSKDSVINIVDKLNNYLNYNYRPSDVERVVTWFSRFSIKMNLVQLEVSSFDNEHLLSMLNPNFNFSNNSPMLAKHVQVILNNFAVSYCKYLNTLDTFGIIAVPKNR